MKCEHCGNNLSLEDKVCPYCGKENKFARQHIDDMDKFKEDYASVKKEVLTNSRRFNGVTARITIIAILLVLIAAVTAGMAKSYDIREKREERRVLRHLDEYRAGLDRLIEARDYLGVHYYFMENRISFSRYLDEYEIAYMTSSQYKSLLDSIYYLHGEDSYVDDEEAMEDIAYSMEKLYEYREPQSEYDKNRYYTNDDVSAYVVDLVDHSHILIKGYFGFSDEDAEKFKSLSRARKQLMLEEGWGND